MNIDAHVHLVGKGWLHEDFFVNLIRTFTASNRDENGDYPDPALVVDGVKDALFDTSGEKLLKEMDGAGVDRSCIFALDYGLLTGDPGVSMEEQNQTIATVAERFPDRFTGFFTIDPRRPQALDLFRRAVENWGLRGLKLHPASGWYPSDERFYPLYEQCMAYGLPMLIHTGGHPAPLKSRFGRPIYVDDVAAEFPDLSIIMAHCGHRWWQEALLVCDMKPNCHVDISGRQPQFVANPGRFYQWLRRIIDTVGPWRVIFATDGPYLNSLCSLTDWVSAFRKPTISPQEVSFKDEEMDIIMGKAIHRLLRASS